MQPNPGLVNLEEILDQRHKIYSLRSDKVDVQLSPIPEISYLNGTEIPLILHIEDIHVQSPLLDLHLTNLFRLCLILHLILQPINLILDRQSMNILLRYRNITFLDLTCGRSNRLHSIRIHPILIRRRRSCLFPL